MTRTEASGGSGLVLWPILAVQVWFEVGRQ
jgi:hypothetical protein